ncbi:DMT family transporter [Silvimonas amylolytica]|uniref:QacE family quaternary ammonium compound efflux SMR transporter n=1 Tax=Silvimonas amylolytica TaxID=449663 RepID=A0ABQ2PRT3_9NEIS|nr:multidrug efflux SMR transporter [Silvimonas amylolytica]GGP28157.1 QacE family quaternary ammonium compound efflux SMR transporter [Silvimonas amylolytica]
MPAYAFAWWMLVISIAAEVTGTIALKYSHGLSRWFPTLCMGACYATAIWLMGISTRVIPISTAYAVWAVACTALTAVIGVIWFGEGISLIKTAGLGCALFSLVLLNLADAAA